MHRNRNLYLPLLLLLLLHAANIIPGKVIVDYYRTDSRNPLNAKKKGETSDDTTIDSINTIYLQPDEVCGALLSSPNTKYIIDSQVPTIQCLSGNGPSLSFGAILDCDGTEVTGNKLENTYGALIDFDGVIQNCKFSNFFDGIVVWGPVYPTERQIIYNSETTQNMFGIYSRLADVKMVQVESYQNTDYGYFYDTSISRIYNSKFNNNGGTGIAGDSFAISNERNSLFVYDSQTNDNVENGVTTGYADFIFMRHTFSGNQQKGYYSYDSIGTLNEVTVQNNFNSGLMFQQTYAHIESSSFIGNLFGIEAIEGSKMRLACCTVVEQFFDGIYVEYSAANITDSEISNNAISNNLFTNIFIQDSAVDTQRVRACESLGNDIDESGDTVLSASSTTCDNHSACHMSCGQCVTGIPAWCSAY